MPQQIRDVLNRRNDLSTFVVHLTRDYNGVAAQDNLRQIIQQRRLLARTAMGWATNQDNPNDSQAQTQRVVSFSETPLEHIYSLVADIANRSVNLRPYGLALTKVTARRLGINPAWYVDMTPGRTWEAAAALDALRDAAVGRGNFHEEPIARVLPFFEPMGTWPSRQSQREFWWEREWRHVGDMQVNLADAALWLSPEEELDALRNFIRQELGQPNALVPCIDPRWGLEQIVATLAGQTEITPFQP